MPGAKGSGGRRPGAGRKRIHPEKPKPVLPVSVWREIRRSAEFGATEEEIQLGLDLPPTALEDPATLVRFRAEISKGHAFYKLELRKAIRQRGMKAKIRDNEVAGSVNALGLQARNILDWDKQIPTQEMQPDLTTARQRLQDQLVKLAEVRSDLEGRRVTVEELLARIASGDIPGPDSEPKS